MTRTQESLHGGNWRGNMGVEMFIPSHELDGSSAESSRLQSHERVMSGLHGHTGSRDNAGDSIKSHWVEAIGVIGVITVPVIC